MRLIIGALLQPLPIFWFLLLLAALLLYLKKKKAGKGVLLGAGIWLFLISTPFLPGLLVSILEKPHRSSLAPEKIITDKQADIIVLGAGYSDDPALVANDQLGTTALARLSEGIRLHRMIPGSKLICSGYAGKLGISQAKVLAKTALIGLYQPDGIGYARNHWLLGGQIK